MGRGTGTVYIGELARRGRFLHLSTLLSIHPVPGTRDIYPSDIIRETGVPARRERVPDIVGRARPLGDFFSPTRFLLYSTPVVAEDIWREDGS